MLEPCSCHLHSHHRHHRCHLQCHHPQRPGTATRRPGHATDPSSVVAEGSNNYSAVLTKNVQFHSKRETAKRLKKAIMEIRDIWPYLYTSFLLDSDTSPQTRWCMGGNVSQVWNHLDTSIYLLKDKQPGPNIEGNGLDDPQWPWHGKRPASLSCQVYFSLSFPNPNKMII